MQKLNLMTNKQVSNPNLLINGDFRVNQRGKSVYTTPNAYTVDRWIVNCGDQNFSLITKENGGVTIQNNSGGDIFFVQFIEAKDIPWGKDVVFHIQTSQGEIITLGKLPTIIPTTETTLVYEAVQDWGGIYMYYFPHAGLQAVVRIHGNATVDIEWAKVEVGTIATSYSPRTYTEELALCQRYFLPLSANDSNAVNGYSTAAGNAANIKFFMPTNLRIKPTITTISLPRIRYNGGDYSVTNISVVNFGSFGITLSYETSSIPNNQSVSSYGLDAELDAEIY